MCTGRVDLAFILRAFSNGSDGVFIGGCHLGECHYVTNGNYAALNTVLLCKQILAHIGVNPDRLRIEWLSAGEGIRFAEVMNDFGKNLKKLGPIREDNVGKEWTSAFESMMKLIPYIKLASKEKLAMRLDKEEEYNALFTDADFDQLLRTVPSFYIDPEKCKACMICMRKCPVEAIAGGKNLIHVIDQDKCIKCGTCYDACPDRFQAIKKLTGEPVPPPIPDDQRHIDRKNR